MLSKRIMVCIVAAFLLFFCFNCYAAEEISIQEQTIVDANGVVITAKEYRDSQFSVGPEIVLSIENNTPDKITVRLDRTSVNDIMFPEAVLYETIDAQSNKGDTITIPQFALDDVNIEKIAKIETAFIISNGNKDDEYTTDVVSIDTSVGEDYVQKYDDSGELLLERNGFRLIKQEGYMSSDLAGQYLYADNDSDGRIQFIAKNISVNGISFDNTLTFTAIEAGKKLRTLFSLFNNELKDKGISQIKSMEADFSFIDPDSSKELFAEHLVLSGDAGDELTSLNLQEGVAFSDEIAEVSLSNYTVDNLEGVTAEVEIRNKANQKIQYTPREIRVNGIKVNGSTGNGSWSHDNMIDIEPEESYSTHLYINRDGLNENIITEIQKIEIDMSFWYTGGVYNFTVDVPLASKSATSQQVASSDILHDIASYLAGTRSFYSGEKMQCIIYDFTNPNNVPVTLEAKMEFLDKNGEVVDSQEETIYQLSPQAFIPMFFTTESEYDTRHITLTSKRSNYQNADLSYTKEVTDDGKLLIRVKNEGESASINTQLSVVVFTKAGLTNGWNLGFDGGKNCISIAPNETVTRVINNYDNYNYYIYLSGQQE